jgi:hypothetical protein
MKTNLLILVDEDLVGAELAIKEATCETIVQLCRDYLLLLSNYRDKLYKLRGTPEICVHQSSPIARGLVEQTRKAIRTALEVTITERNEIESLLKSFTTISGYESTVTLNQFQYDGISNWELGSGGVYSKNQKGEKRLSMQDAVVIAGILRREAYIAAQPSTL